MKRRYYTNGPRLLGLNDDHEPIKILLSVTVREQSIMNACMDRWRRSESRGLGVLAVP
jgi:hypothetical protein